MLKIFQKTAETLEIIVFLTHDFSWQGTGAAGEERAVLGLWCGTGAQ